MKNLITTAGIIKDSGFKFDWLHSVFMQLILNNKAIFTNENRFSYINKLKKCFIQSITDASGSVCGEITFLILRFID
jgi:hypothetical protein